MTDIVKDDICVVSDQDDIYSSYKEFANAYGHPDAITKSFPYHLDGRLVKVLLVDEHLTRHNMLAIVETIKGPYYKFIIGLEGLIKIREKL